MPTHSGRLSGALGAILALLLALMVVLVFGNVVLRYAFNSGITVSEELARWLFVWMTFLGAVLALRERAHLGTDMLLSRLGPAGQRLCLLLAQALMLWVTWLMASGSWTQVQINWAVKAPVSGASVGLFYASGTVFALASGAILLHEFWLTLSGRRSDAELVMVQESEDLAQIDALHLNQSQTFRKP